MSTAVKKVVLVLMVILYMTLAVGFKVLVDQGVIQPLVPTPQDVVANESAGITPSSDVATHLNAAQQFVQNNLVKDAGHVNLYVTADPAYPFPDKSKTNSEAVSYYLLWNAQADNKEQFDTALAFMEQQMMHPQLKYIQWRLEEDGSIVTDGSNIASDADMRAIKALLIAEGKWEDARYTQLIDELASGLERVAITPDGYLAPYGGGSVGNTWTAQEVWLSYSDFTVMRELANRRGDPWPKAYTQMKQAVLDAQIYNGLYNSQLTIERKQGNSIDQGAYSINSLWIMVRAAESSDPQLQDSARKSLEFYKQQFNETGKIYQAYTSQGTPVKEEDAPWTYALVGRAAIALNDYAFATKMVDKLVAFQIVQVDHPWNGALPEGDGQTLRVGQFTMQESILTLQDYVQQHNTLFIDFRSNGPTGGKP